MKLDLGKYRVSFATDLDDVRATQRLRHRAFSRNQPDELDRDTFDDRCTHVSVHHRDTGILVGCFRIMIIPSGADIAASYSAQFYDLSALKTYVGPVAELGRLCVDPKCSDPEVLRAAWAGLAHIVDHESIRLLFGCASFRGTNPAPYNDCFRLLHRGHLAPQNHAPTVKSAQVVLFDDLRDQSFDPKRAQAMMPPLLRTYLLMGGWVSDHAVIDTEMRTLHVFTAVEVDKIPSARRRLLRAMA